MTTARIPAAEVHALLEAIDLAKKLAFEHPDGFDVWKKLVSARSFIKVYLLDQFKPLDVEITP